MVQKNLCIITERNIDKEGSPIGAEEFCASLVQSIKKAIVDFKMFDHTQRIFVAFSGGKDSTVLLSVLHTMGYRVEAITVNAYIGCYSKENVANAQQFCDNLGIPLHHISFRKEFGHSLCHMKALLFEKGLDLKSCSICGVLRRYLLNKHARVLGADVIAFGHNLDDEAQAIMMNMLKGNPSLSARLGPIAGVQAHPGFVRRVKPLYFIPENDVVRYAKIKKFPVHFGECPCSTDSFRHSVKMILRNQSRNVTVQIVETFIRFLPQLKKQYSNSSPGICTTCGEPGQQGECKACQFRRVLVS